MQLLGIAFILYLLKLLKLSADVDECQSNPCVNGGNCTNKRGGFDCSCPSGFTGKTCGQDVDECRNSPCKNGGTCTNQIGTYKCDCLPGYEGKHCDQDVDECTKRNPCKNGATCINLIGGFECRCPAGYHGEVCDQDINECLNNPCQNTGNCINTVGGYNCQCIQGFEGKDCENDTDECKILSPCQNGGTCQNVVGTYKCVCPDEYTGFNCEIRKNFQALGCFSDTVNDRAMDKLLFNFRGQIDWRDMSKTVKNCSEAARKQPRQYTYFAIQYYGECWGALAGTKYDKHGRASDDKCWSGVGGSLTNFVYRLF